MYRQRIHLSPRQLEVIHLIREYPSHSDKELAQKLGIQRSTFKSHVSRVYDRLNVYSRLECILVCQELNLLER